MKKDVSTRFLVSCEFADAAAMSVLMEGCRAHADVDAFPLWTADFEPFSDSFLNRLTSVVKLEETWIITFPNRASLETFTELLTSIEFHKPDYIRFVVFDDAFRMDTIFKMDAFHKHVFHERER